MSAMAVDPCFSCLKITLIVVHVLCFLSLISLIIISTLALVFIPQQNYDEIDAQKANVQLRSSLLIMSASFVFALISLVGVIRENKLIVISVLIVYAISAEAYLVVNPSVVGFVLELPFPALTALYVYLLFIRKRMQINSD
ncbi:uncharacterized protein LOC128964360 [Oppia nitens]|uniref:uncharacterized protein LOC128964360 n=1 Tax=Oppia nitens TaxID=1686743 RepID=UPI0023D998CE|nr:uncharacterized protein LOC128964360 [Oppia nitens]